MNGNFSGGVPNERQHLDFMRFNFYFPIALLCSVMEPLQDKIFSISPAIRYLAVYENNVLDTWDRPGIENASSSESDRYEELIVNPTLLKLLTQRGNIDCGGLDYVLIRYGVFYALVIPLSNGHLTVGIEPDADPTTIIPAIQQFLIEPA